jgi:hypothetical protein
MNFAFIYLFIFNFLLSNLYKVLILSKESKVL